jgi:uncharacterized protein (TIRG00374 family)
VSTSASPATNRKLPLTWLLRLGVSALVLFVLFRLVPLERVWSEAQRIPVWLWFAALGLFLLGHAAATVKWRLLIGGGVSFPQAFQAHLAGLAANVCLPGLGSGDVVRAALVFRSAKDAYRLVVGSFADRLIDMLGLLLFAVSGAFVAAGGRQSAFPQLAWLLVAAVLALVISLPASLILERATAHWNPSGRVGRALLHAIRATSYLLRQPGRLLLCLAISMAIQATFIAINVAFAVAVAVVAPIAAWFFAWSTAKIVAIAPISLGGLGVREAVMATLLAPFGADPAQVIAIGLIWQTVLYASSLVAALAQFAWNPESARTRVGAPGEGAERSS